MIKIHALVSDLEKASQKLAEAIALPQTEINRDATIQRFEFTFELLWKTLQAILVENGIQAYGPKNAFREAGKLGLLEDVEKWFSFLEARNLASHTYNETLAKTIYQDAKVFLEELKKVLPIIRERINLKS